MKKQMLCLFSLLLIGSLQAAKQRFEGLQEKLPYLASEQLGVVGNAALNFLSKDKDNLKCLVFGKGCDTKERDALLIIDAFLSTESIKPHLSQAALEERIRLTEEALRDEYDASREEYQSLGLPILSLLQKGQIETNWSDRQLKKMAHMYGLDKIKNDKKLLNYLTHLYFGTMPTEELREQLIIILNPTIEPRPTALQKLFRWGVKTGGEGYEYLKEKGGEGYRWTKKMIKEKGPVLRKKGTELLEKKGEPTPPFDSPFEQ